VVTGVVNGKALVVAIVDEVVVLTATPFVVVVVAMGVSVTAADITALQSTGWYLGCVLWSMRPSRGRR
jgi:hypothetical protein